LEDKLDIKLKRLRGGFILDVAAGRGDSLKYLVDTMSGFEYALGVDYSLKNITEAAGKFNDDRIELALMDAARLGLPDGCFDTVTMVNSLHHLADPKAALAEMKRVLKPGGLLMVCEMRNDVSSDEKMTHVLMHHWWAEIDRLDNIDHYPTFSGQQLEAMTHSLALDNPETIPLITDPELPENNPGYDALEKICRDYLARIGTRADSDRLIREGNQILERIKQIGLCWADRLCFMGHKPN